MTSSRALPFLGLVAAVIACSSAALMLKACSLPPEVISAVRLLLATAILLPVFLREKNSHGTIHFTPEHSRRTWLPALALAAHFIFWAYGAHATLTAQASLIVNLAPVAMPFFLHAVLKERINRWEIMATGVVMAGFALFTIQDALAGTGSWVGNLACFVAMLFLAWYFALGRRNRDFASVWLYVVPVYFRAGLICLILSVPRLSSLWQAPFQDWLLLVALAVIPTVLGHSLINLSMRHFRGQTVSLANTCQFISAGILAWLWFGEIPSALFYPAAMLVVAGVILAIRSTPKVNPA